MKKSIRLNDSARVMKVHEVMIVGNTENGSFIALNTDGEDIVEKARLDFFEIDMDKVSDDVKNIIDAGIECEIFDELNSERMKSACGIRAAYLHVTNKCNYNCIGCYSENSLRNCAKDLTTTDIKVIIDKLSGVGVEVLAVSGGEPFIREDILEILSYAKKKIKKVIIGSNGTMITEEIASKLPNIVDSVNLAIDGYEKDKDFVRNRNATRIALEKVKLLKKYNVNVVLVATIHKLNYMYTENFYKMAKSEEVPITFSILTCNTADEDIAKYILNADEFQQMSDDAQKYGIMIEDNVSEGDWIVFRKNCGAGRRMISVDATGKVYPCHMLHYSDLCMGNLLTEELDNIMDSKALKDFSDVSVETVEKCVDCTYKYFCGGGCRAREYLTVKKLGNCDRYCQSYYKNFDKFGMWLEKAKEEQENVI